MKSNEVTKLNEVTKSKELLKLQLKLLQDKSQQINNYNISKLNSHKEFINAFKKKYPTFFNIIETQGIPYKQFLSGFFNCILTGQYEPFYIRTYKNNKISNYTIFDRNSSNYNYVTLLPWNKLNIIKCENKYRSIQYTSKPLIRINKEQFMQSLIILFPEFIRKHPNILLNLNQQLKETSAKTISVSHLYKFLVYCGDKLAKDNVKLAKDNVKLAKDNVKLAKDNSQLAKELTNKRKYIYVLSKYKIYQFLKIFTYEQLTKILISNNI